MFRSFVDWFHCVNSDAPKYWAFPQDKDSAKRVLIYYIDKGKDHASSHKEENSSKHQ